MALDQYRTELSIVYLETFSEKQLMAYGIWLMAYAYGLGLCHLSSVICHHMRHDI